MKIEQLKMLIYQQAVHCSDWLMPCVCVLCGKLTYNNYNLCAACEHDLPLLQRMCTQCGKELAQDFIKENKTAKSTLYGGTNIDIPDGLDIESEETGMVDNDIVQPSHLLCGSCLKHAPPFTMTISLYHYSSPIDYLILGLKFGNRLINGKLLGTLLAKRLQQVYTSTKPEVILPIPLHKARLRERGYNQALELARPSAQLLKIPIDALSCQRAKNTSAQSLLKVHARKDNVRGAFVVKHALPYQYVAVIDDVITTGSTVREFCCKLRAAGVARIDVWSCAQA